MSGGVDALLVALGAGVGAPARYAVDVMSRGRWGSRWPWGTLAVNLLGSLALGLVLGSVAGGAPHRAYLLLGVGFCGALTTFSTFALELVTLGGSGRRRDAAGYALLSLAAGLVLVALGVTVGRG